MINFDIDQAVNDINSGAFNQDGSGQVPDQQSNVGMHPQQPINQTPYDPNINIPYKANGKEITEPLSTVIQRASMGYNYAQLMQQYKQQQAELEAQRQQIEQQAQKWRQYDEYATQNPEWANHVRTAWESRFAQSSQSNGFDSQFQSPTQSQLPPEISRELAEMRSFVNQYKEEQHARMMAEQDAALAQEIQSVQSEHPTIDLRATDPMTGESLEAQVLRHAQANGISSFRAAFRDMMFDRILAEKQTAAKEVVAKQMQQQVKQGFLGQSDTPMMQSQQPVNLSRHSYHSLVDLAIKDLGLT